MPTLGSEHGDAWILSFVARFPQRLRNAKFLRQLRQRISPAARESFDALVNDLEDEHLSEPARRSVQTIRRSVRAEKAAKR